MGSYNLSYTGAQVNTILSEAKTHVEETTHARSDATKTEKSSTNGNIKINGTETVVYTHPTTSGNKHIPSGGSSGQILRWSADGTAVWGDDNNTHYNFALDNDRNIYLTSDDVSTYAAGVTGGSGEEYDATYGIMVPNIGELKFGSYWRNIKEKPSTFTPSTHTHSKTEVGLGNVGNFKAVSTVASQGLSDAEKVNARANIGAISNKDLSNAINNLASIAVFE